ncbi:MAG: diguanylate cyclase [Lachnospiraceae bacterium]|nr:diguanylate cyclase [Lachnospiraceae bacterium]
MKHISVKIALLVAAAEIMVMATLFLFLNGRLSEILEKSLISDMGVIAHHRADLAENYIEGRCDFLNGYARCIEAIHVLEDPEDPQLVEAARECTDNYAAGYDSIEGLYVAFWDTYVLAHTNPDSVAKTFRDRDSAKELEDLIRKHQTSFCTGIVQAPVTKKMVMPVYSPVKNDEGEMLGFAGAAFYPEAIGVQLDAGEETKYDYTILNCSNRICLYDSADSGLVGMENKNKALWNEVEQIKKSTESAKQGSLNFGGRVMSVYYMPDYDWIFVVSESEDDVFALVDMVRNTIMHILLPITFVLVLGLGFVIGKLMNPIGKINNQIIRLEASDFSRGHDVEKYTGRRDEFGTISRAVMKLHSTLENQDELFREMLDAQTAGLVVSKDSNHELILINQKALALYGIPYAEKASVMIESIRALFSEEELAHIDEQLQKVTEQQKEVVIESSIIYRDGSKGYLLTHVKSVTLSNRETVSIYSLVDISERKKLEQELQIQSETDFLTGICNRRSGELNIEKAVSEGKYGMFCLFDANKFKTINDTYGHNAGDEVLIGIAKAMQDTFRSSDILVRLGGDEFVVYAPGMPDEKVGTQVLERFIKNIEKISPDSIRGHKVTISLGAVMVTEAMSFTEMYNCADSLMYQCKMRGGSAFEFYRK